MSHQASPAMRPSSAWAQQRWVSLMSAGASDSAVRFTVLIEPAGPVFQASARTPLLQSAREAGWVLRSSCRNGSCRACMCRLVSGRAGDAIEWPGLSAEEKAEGFILPCVALPASALVIEAPRLVDARAGSVATGR